MMLEKIAIFMIFLGPLVFFHELGHFLFARLFGVRVEVFSIGFGPKLFKKKWGDTEYAFSLIPLGGYVKMFGDDPLRSDDLTEEEKKVAYTAKGKWARFWIVFGGPLANFILAFFIYFSLVATGENVPEPRFGFIPKNTRFHELGIRSGDVLKEINKKEILSFDDLNMIDSEVKSITVQRAEQLQIIEMDYLGMQFIQDFSTHNGQLRAPILADGFGTRYVVSLDKQKILDQPLESLIDLKVEKIFLVPITDKISSNTQLDSIKTDFTKAKEYTVTIEKGLLSQLINLKYYPLDLLVESIVMGSPADKANLKQGDIIISVNEKELTNFEDLRASIQSTSSNSTAKVTLLRSGKQIDLDLIPEMKEVQGQKVLTIGIYSGIVIFPIKMVESKARGLFESLAIGWNRTADGLNKTLLGFKKLITAEVSLNNIGGPIAIGKVASDSFSISLSMFFRLMAIMSINLGIINLFPIPVLDGGHIVFIFLELINGGPLSRRKLQIAQQFGMSLLFLLIFVALFNDISRLF